ncbi:hypothetical protein RJT34_32442 [Clitoria ternatea]|uniref:Uncharacterized protein n=1 Tax=Clitoria ternatea TaxID=43366 RepID=A0AAN9EY52_CLITE
MAESVAISASFSLNLKPSTIHRSHTLSSFRSHFPAFTHFTIHSNRQLLHAAVSSDSKAVSPDLNLPEFGNSGGGPGGDGNGNSFGGGGGGGGRGDNNKGEEGSDGEKKKMALSMSQKLTLAYAALVGAGGVMGFLKSGSNKSLLAGGLSASLLFYVYTELPVRPVLASSLGLGISAALLGVMGSRFKKSGKVFPAGVVSLVSLIMTGGYLHGIMRSAH